jgi:hypothetical protein
MPMSAAMADTLSLPLGGSDTLSLPLGVGATVGARVSGDAIVGAAYPPPKDSSGVGGGAAYPPPADDMVRIGGAASLAFSDILREERMKAIPFNLESSMSIIFQFFYKIKIDFEI